MADRNMYIVQGTEFRRVIEALREANDSMLPRIRSALREAVKPVVADVRMAATALPARGIKHTGLRARVAKGVGVKASVGRNPGLKITTSMVDPGEAMLPRGLDSGDKGWRHPVFGNTDNWVQQRGGSWFRETIGDDQDIILRHIVDVIVSARDRIDAAGA